MRPDYDNEYPYLKEMDSGPYHRALLTASIARMTIVVLVTLVGSRFLYLTLWNRIALILSVVLVYGMMEWAEFLKKTRRSRRSPYDSPVD